MTKNAASNFRLLLKSKDKNDKDKSVKTNVAL